MFTDGHVGGAEGGWQVGGSERVDVDGTPGHAAGFEGEAEGLHVPYEGVSVAHHTIDDGGGGGAAAQQLRLPRAVPRWEERGPLVEETAVGRSVDWSVAQLTLVGHPSNGVSEFSANSLSVFG